MVKVIREGSDEAQAPTPKEFEELLNESEEMGFVLPGEIVTGTVVRVGREWVFVDLGGKSEGVIPVQEMTDEEGNVTVKPLDEVEATVLTTRGGIRLSIKLQKGDQTDEVLRDAFESQIPVEGRVVELNKGGFRIDIGEHRAFCPISQIDDKYVEDANPYLDQVFQFRIIEFKPEQRNIVVSRRIILEAERKVLAAQVKEGIKIGQLLTGVVKKLMPFGAFVDVGGVDGLVHVSQISWDRVEDPAQVLAEGQSVKVKVLKFDRATDRLALSIKEACADPWANVEDEWPVGTVLEGQVTRVERFGAFVRIAEGVEGLVHISDMTWAGRVRHPSDIVGAGDKVRVQILGVSPDQRRISLGMKQAEGDPWDEVVQKYPIGSAISGEVERIASGGVFIKLGEGVTAFLPGSLAGLGQGEPLGGTFKPGKRVTLLVKEIDKERRRMTLTAGTGTADQEQAEVKEFLAKQQAVTRDAPNGPGSFGMLLESALKKKPRR